MIKKKMFIWTKVKGGTNITILADTMGHFYVIEDNKWQKTKQYKMNLNKLQMNVGIITLQYKKDF